MRSRIVALALAGALPLLISLGGAYDQNTGPRDNVVVTAVPHSANGI